MSPASKAKSKDKKAGKDPQKVSLKPSILANMTSGTPVSGYNPLLGKFHTIEAAPVSSASSLQGNGRFRNIDETDDFSGSSGGNGTEYDTLSNNGSWSGESEDHKDKPNSLHREAIPGVDSDKREKIRQKNERKHQRQKERRALELHERCNGFLMSRKLEVLAQQLVAMGFPQERATMALILNEGKIEESVAWLFEGGEEAVDTHLEHHNLDGGNLKIDISDELARIADMEMRYKCSRQEVERAIVTCEGDLEKAADMLRVQKQDSPSASPKPDETGDPPTQINDILSLSNNHNTLRMQPKPMSSRRETLVERERERERERMADQKSNGGDSMVAEPPIDRPVRVYADGIYDLFHFGHARSLEQAKKVFPNTYLLVGCCNDEVTHKYKGKTVMTDTERYESLRHCKWVDEVIPDAPWVINQEFLDKHQIDYVAHDSLPYADASGSCKDVYEFVRAVGKFKETKRTKGISTSDIIMRIVKDYNQYVLRNLDRGYSRKELGVSYVKEKRLRVNRGLLKLSEEVKKQQEKVEEKIKTVKRQRNIWVENADRMVAGFLEMFEEGCHKMGTAIRDRIQERLLTTSNIKGLLTDELGSDDDEYYYGDSTEEEYSEDDEDAKK